MRRVIALIGALGLVLQGCASMQTVDVPQGGTGQPAVQVGDTVEVTTRSGDTRRFEVTQVTDDAIVGKDVRIAYSDVTSLKVARENGGKPPKALWIVGGVLLAALLVGASGDGGSSY